MRRRRAGRPPRPAPRRSPTTGPASSRSGASSRPRSPTGWPSSATRPTAIPGLPGWGAKSAAAVLRRYGSIDAIPAKASQWDVPGVTGAVRLAAVLAEQHDDAILYRTLARLRLDTPIPQQTAAELEWHGAPRATWEAFCDAGAWSGCATGRTAGSERRGAAPGGRASTRRRSRASSEPRMVAPAAPRRRAAVRVARAGSYQAGSVERGDGGAGPLGDQPGRGDVPGREAALLDERVEPAVADVGERRATRSPSSAATRTPCGSPGPGSTTERPGERRAR